jgi:hypothetical protein
MTNTNDKSIICRDLERTFNRGSSLNWTKKDYIKLSDMIFEASNITLTENTLRRFFKAYHTGEMNYEPHESTLNAFALFLGYEDWQKYLQKEQKTTVKPKQESKKKWLYLILILIVIPIYFLLKPSYYFEVETNETTSSMAPYTVFVKYSTNYKEKDKLNVNFGILGTKNLPINRKDSTLSYCYTEPYFTYMSFYKRNHILKSIPVYIKSSGWQAGYVSTETYKDDINQLRIKKRERVVLDAYNFNQETNFISREILAENNLDTGGFYYTDFRYFEEIAISGDNMNLTAEFINGKNTGGISGYNVSFHLFFTNGYIRFILIDKGIEAFTECHVSDVHISNSKRLLDFNHIQGTPTKVFVESENKTVKISTNNKLIQEVDYSVLMGAFKGIIITFQGSGKLLYLQMKDNENSDANLKL